jgi:hypothetical protein
VIEDFNHDVSLKYKAIVILKISIACLCLVLHSVEPTLNHFSCQMSLELFRYEMMCF